ncbi:MAG: hypothetical protein QM709_03135 [Spongiibacteraceae bacterium]
MIGFEPDRDYNYLEINKALRKMLPGVVKTIKEGLLTAGADVYQQPSSELLYVNDEFTVSVVIARCIESYSGRYSWRIRFDRQLTPDLSIVVRMMSDNEHPLDYYIFPRIDLPLIGARLDEENNLSLDAYRFDSLDSFYSLCQRIALSEVA